MSLSSFPHEFGTRNPETEAVLGAIMDDLDYVEKCLEHMSIVELTRFMEALGTLYKRIQDNMTGKGLAIRLTNLQIHDELTSIIKATAC